MHSALFLAVALAAAAEAHVAAWADGMYCKGGNVIGIDDSNTDSAVNPLNMMTQDQWWFQHYQGCDLVPPPEGEFLELPAGGDFTVELAHNRGQTTLSFGGQFTSEWPDGQQHPEDWSGDPLDGEGCIQNDGAMHVQNQTMATGTAFAISYESDISAVTMENLAVFTVLEHTPWKRISTYSVPAAMPACPPGGCTCAWLWIPNGCGIQNMYMQGYKCNVTGATSTAPVAPAQAPVYCGNDASTCVQGAKQMLVWHQATGNNISPPSGVSPGYNSGMGWAPGAQDDIFVSAQISSSTSTTSAMSSTTTSMNSNSTPVLPTASAMTNTSSSLLLSMSSYTPPVIQPISTSSSPIATSTSPPSTPLPTTLLTLTISPLPTTSAPMTTASVTPSTIYAASSTSSAPPMSTSDMFPDFVKWMESAWAEWVASHGGQA